MAEIEKTSSVNAGELAQRFVQFIMMHAQQILFVLGSPTPEGESMPPNLEGGKILIDQLEMIQEKTKNNLSRQEASILEEALTRVRFAYVQAANGIPGSYQPEAPAAAREEKPAPPQASAPAKESEDPSVSSGSESENKKKFTKTYN